MSVNSLAKTALIGVTMGLSLLACSRRPSVPPEPQVILEATSTVHGIGDYVDVELWVRLKDDGSVEWEETKWEENQGVFTPGKKKFAKGIPVEDAIAIRQRLTMIDASQLQERMGPYAVYVDTHAELKVHLATSKGMIDLTLVNPWASATRRYKGAPIQEMTPSVKSIVCEVSRLRHRLTPQPLDEICELPTSKGH